MANQTRQLREFLARDGVPVEVLASNIALWPPIVDRIRGVRGAMRLVIYLGRLWRLAGRVDLLHVLANSGLTWHLVAAPALVVGRLRRTPVIINYRGGGARRFFARQWRWIMPTMRLATVVIVPSPFLRDVFDEYGVKAELIANAVDVDKFVRSDYAAICRNRIAEIVTTRNLEPIYDIETAIRAFALVRREIATVHLTIAGDGPQRPVLERLVRELGLSGAVTFSGRLKPAELARLLGRARLLLNSSRVDNMPNSLLEALATGLPLVSTNVGGIPRIIEDGRTGFLVPAGDAEAMAGAALHLLKDEVLAARVSRAAATVASDYSWEVIGRQWRSAYERVHNDAQ